MKHNMTFLAHNLSEENHYLPHQNQENDFRQKNFKLSCYLTLS